MISCQKIQALTSWIFKKSTSTLVLTFFDVLQEVQGNFDPFIRSRL